MTPKHVEWVATHLDEWCQPLRLTLEPSSVTSFYVDLGSRSGLRRRTPAPLEGRVLFLDTRPLHAVMVQHVVTLEQYQGVLDAQYDDFNRDDSATDPVHLVRRYQDPADREIAGFCAAALAFGAGFGGNGTIIGSTANIIVATLSEKTRTPITSRIWNRRGLPVMLATCLVASLLFILFYERF